LYAGSSCFAWFPIAARGAVQPLLSAKVCLPATGWGVCRMHPVFTGSGFFPSEHPVESACVLPATTSALFTLVSRRRAVCAGELEAKFCVGLPTLCVTGATIPRWFSCFVWMEMCASTPTPEALRGCFNAFSGPRCARSPAGAGDALTRGACAVCSGVTGRAGPGHHPIRGGRSGVGPEIRPPGNR